MLSEMGSALQLFVNRLTSRSTLTRAEVTAVLNLTGRSKQIRGHVDLFRPGQQVDHTCLVVEGVVGRFGQSKNGLRQITCLYIAGDMADLPSVVSPNSGWGLSTLSNTTIMLVAHSDLRRVAATHPGIAEAFWRDCVADGSIFAEWVVNVGRRDAVSRVAHLFCEMAIRCEQAGLGDRHSFKLPITQSDLGDATGLTSVHVNRTLKALRHQSIVTAQSGMITVHDWARMARIGNFNAAFMLLEGPSPRISAAA